MHAGLRLPPFRSGWEDGPNRYRTEQVFCSILYASGKIAEFIGNTQRILPDGTYHVDIKANSQNRVNIKAYSQNPLETPTYGQN